ncbi:MAG: ABC transporter permease, partial [Myxococcota bacterium]|nr:ABC transporter permease [Myxococcota bacterium]
MLRYALRRVLWAIPTLLATSLVLFFVTTLAPDPVTPQEDPGFGSAMPSGLIEARRTRFLDLPRFFNSRPQDVRSRAYKAVEHIAADDAERGRSARELRVLGGAALPYVLPLLESLAPDSRARVAIALAPLAARMHLADERELQDPPTAVLFWTHVWDNRALDFARSAVERAVRRLVEHGSDLREGDLVALDTFALPEVLRAMTSTSDLPTLQRLTRVANHCTERGPVLDAAADDDAARRAVADWQEWWFVHASHFTALDGAARALAMVAETRYGKWLKRASSGELGVSAVDG